MKRIITAIAIVTALFSTMYAAKTKSTQQPDFAYPQTVSTQALEYINEGLNKHSDTLVIKGELLYALAQSNISRDNFGVIIAKIDSAARFDWVKSDIPLSSILSSLKAQVYAQYYYVNRSKFRSRTESVTPLPADVDVWTESQMLEQIKLLLDSSLADAHVLSATKLDQYLQLLNYNKYGLDVCPDAYSFLLMRAINILSQFGTKCDSACNEYRQKFINHSQSSHNVFAELYMLTSQSLRSLLYTTDQSDMDYFDKWKVQYDKYSSSQYSGLLITTINLYKLTNDEKVALYAIISQFEKSYPDYPFMNDIASVKSTLTVATVEACVATIVKSGAQISATVVCDNASQVGVKIYKLPESYTASGGYKLSDCTLVYDKTIKQSKTAPYYNDTIKVEFDALPYGKYLIATTLPGSVTGSTSSSIFAVSDIFAYSIYPSYNDYLRIIVVDATTGAQIKGATVKACKTLNNNSQKILDTQSTDGNGIAKFGANIGARYFDVSNGNDKYYDKLYGTSSSTMAGATTRASIFTDLGVYHPGGKIKFVAVVYNTDSKNNRYTLDNDNEYRADFINASGSLIDSLEIVTDNWGRATGEFTVPEGMMNGDFKIQLYKSQARRNYSNRLATKSVAVAEYKAPTFYVELSDIKRNYSSMLDTIRISGGVKTYSGAALSGTRVNVSLRGDSYEFWRSYSSEQLVDSMEIITDDNGEFSILLSTQSLKIDNGFRNVRYTLNAGATSLSGESQSTGGQFTIGVGGDIRILDNANIEAGDDVQLPVEVTTYGDSIAECRFKFVSGGKTVLSGLFNPNGKKVDISSIPSGKYRLFVALDADTTINSSADVVVYRETDKKCPIESALWIPKASVKQSQSGSVSFQVGSNTASRIYYVSYTVDTLLSQGWINLSAGLKTVKLSVSKNIDKTINVKLYTVKNYSMSSGEIAISPIKEPEKLNVTVESFRDKVNCGDKEHWSFKFTDNIGNFRQSAMMLDVYNAAIDAIAPNRFTFTLSGGLRNMHVMERHHSIGIARCNTASKPSSASEESETIDIPEFCTYGARLFNSGILANVVARGRYVSKKTESTLLSIADAAEDGVDVVYATLHESAASVASGSVEMSNDTDEAEDAVIDSSEYDTVELRQDYIENLLWLPSLSTDGSGGITFDFDVPNYNTQWNVRAIAYTDNMLISNIARQFESSKPIMVQPNTPRFLHNGDKADISALVINNSTEACSIKVLFEIYNPMDSSVYVSTARVLELQAAANASVDITWSVPMDISVAGIRVRAIDADFSDGEQDVFPIIAPISPVTEAVNFYLNPGQKEGGISTGTIPQDAKVTLSYCNNPAWTCISALPALFNTSGVTATSLAHTLYAVYVARGIVKANPQVAEAINYWKSNPEDSVLISALEKNKDLKISDIAATPWLSAATRQTEQMQNLSKLIDDAYTSTVIKSVIESLYKLQNADGSFSWLSHSTGSYYITEDILSLIGEVNSMGYLDNNEALSAMIQRAIAYVDSEIMRQYNAQHDKKDYTIFCSFYYTRSMFPEYAMSTTLREMCNRALSYMAKNWRKKSATAKAVTAIMLARNGRNSEAEKIVESLRQYSISTTDKGTYWDILGDGYTSKVSSTALMLQALHAVNSSDKLIDSVRQWLLLDKQLNDWGSSSLATHAIYAITTTGSPWLNSDNEINISINGTPLNIEKYEKYTGALTRSITVPASGAEISVSRTGDSPAWGSVILQYVASSSDIKAASTDELSIEKEYYKVVGDRLTDATQLRVGDKLRVMLTVKSNKDMEYVTIHDERSAAMEPCDELSGYKVSNNVWLYQETKNSETNMYIGSLSKGTHTLFYDVTISASGEYTSGIATVQSQYAPQQVSHSAAKIVKIED